MSNIPAGYYPDPAGSPHQRWWNGSSWGELQAAPAHPYAGASPYGAVQPYGATQPYGAVQPYDPSQSYYSTAGLRAPEGTNPNTPAGWIFAFTPLAGLVNVAITAGMGGYDTSFILSSGYSSLVFLSYGFSFLVWLAVILIAFLDYRELRNRQVPKPFHWAFAIIPWSIVYAIGRAVVVYGRTRRGLAPLFVWIGTGVAYFIISLVISFAVTASMMNGYY